MKILHVDLLNSANVIINTDICSKSKLKDTTFTYVKYA